MWLAASGLIAEYEKQRRELMIKVLGLSKEKASGLKALHSIVAICKACQTAGVALQALDTIHDTASQALGDFAVE